MPVSSANGVKALVVLLVEDEFVVRYGTANALREAGYARRRVWERRRGCCVMQIESLDCRAVHRHQSRRLGQRLGGCRTLSHGPAGWRSSLHIGQWRRSETLLPRQCVCCQAVSTLRHLERLRAATHKMTQWGQPRCFRPRRHRRAFPQLPKADLDSLGGRT